MGTLDGKVAFITGVARGQGRAHAIKLATEGASIIGVDICAEIPTMEYPNSNLDDLAETQKLVEEVGGKILTRQADVRDPEALGAAFAEGMELFGNRIDIVLANAGIIRFSGHDDRLAVWKDIIDVNLTGVWNTVETVLPTMKAAGNGGSIVITSSSAGLKGTATEYPGGAAYTAAKRGLVGLMQVLALELAPHSIRVNTIHPTGVLTGMIMNEAMMKMVESGDPALSAMQNALPIEALNPEDIANAVAYLVSDQAYFITGSQWALDAGFTLR